MITFKEYLSEAVIGNKPEYLQKYIRDVYKDVDYELSGGESISVFDGTGALIDSLPKATKVNIVDLDFIQIGKSTAVHVGDGKYIKTTNLEKPKAATSINLGDASEGVVFAAIWLKHTKARAKDEISVVTENDILSFIQKIKWTTNGKTSSISMKEPVYGWGSVFDTVEGNLYLKEASAYALTDKRNAAAIKPLAKESAALVNSRNFERFVKLLHRNEKENFIKIEGLGPLDETGQKIDLAVTIDGKTTRFNSISLKRNSTQLGQKGFSGISTKSYESVKDFFMTYLNVDLSRIKDAYNLAYAEDASEATKIVTKEAISQMKRWKDQTTKEALKNSFKIGAFGGEDISVFDIGKGSRVNTSNVARLIDSFEDLSIEDKSKSYGEIHFYGKKETKRMLIAKVRFKFENKGKTKRIYFETSADFKKQLKY